MHKSSQAERLACPRLSHHDDDGGFAGHWGWSYRGWGLVALSSSEAPVDPLLISYLSFLYCLTLLFNSSACAFFWMHYTAASMFPSSLDCTAYLTLVFLWLKKRLKSLKMVGITCLDRGWMSDDWWTWTQASGTKRIYGCAKELFEGPERSKYFSCSRSLHIVRTVSSLLPTHFEKHHCLMPRVDRNMRWHAWLHVLATTSSGFVCCCHTDTQMHKILYFQSNFLQKYLQIFFLFDSSFIAV